MKSIIIRFFEDFLSLFYPRLCITCGNDLNKQETLLCTKCDLDLPRTQYHEEPNNPIEQTFWGRTRIEHATAFFFYAKGSRYQKLIHDLKYKGKKYIGHELGKKMAKELNFSGFCYSEVIVPVPLHRKKQKKRGYNQSECIASGLSEAMKTPVDRISLYRKTNTQSQTKKSRFDRWENVKNVFEVKDKKAFSNKHVLLVDDVITTGATLEACINQLLACPGCKVSIISLGYSKD
jgi:ComF family protein